MKKYFCNPMNLSYAYQFHRAEGGVMLNREASDPSMVLFKGRYYIFPSMSDGFYASDDLVSWQKYPLAGLPTYDYAPDVRVVGEWLYFCASRMHKNCDFYRTKQPESGEFECIPGNFMFWDPHLFADDDGSMYFYWGCSSDRPVYGVELDPVTMRKLGEEVGLIYSRKAELGYERNGEDHSTDTNPFVEGPWMNKHEGKYYLQYATPGTEYNVYSDGVYVSDHPLGPFTVADNNPFSYSPGGFARGAGHGSTMEDPHGNLWHTSSISISKTHLFERRLGLWPAGFDQDGELFCNQRYGDWPIAAAARKFDPWAEPEWMLLSYNKAVSCSSGEETAENAVDENIQTWWKAESSTPGEWLQVDLGEVSTVNAVQVNFADDFGLVTDVPMRVKIGGYGRFIDTETFNTRWQLEGSTDGSVWITLSDKSSAETDLPHDLVVCEPGVKVRFIRLTVFDLPYGAVPCVSGLRVFGRGAGMAPHKATGVKANRTDALSMRVSWIGNAVGYEVLWGHRPDKLYHSYRVFAKQSQEIRALVADCKQYFVRVDSFNENGITQGEILEAQNTSR